MMPNYNVRISVYRKTSASSEGYAMSLADFMRLGVQYLPQITQYRQLKVQLSTLQHQRDALADAQASAQDELAMGINPLLVDAAQQRQQLEQHLASLQEQIAAIDKEIKPLDNRTRTIKRSLPSATLSGLFDRKRTEEGLLQHSGFICIDIDDHFATTDASGKKRTYTQSLDNVLDVVATLPWVCYAGHSVGGVGYFLLIPLGPLDSQRTHKWYFECLEQEFANLNLVIDPACSDVTRLRIVSHDEHPYRNGRAVPYLGIAHFMGRAERQRIEEEERRRRERARMQRIMSSDLDRDFHRIGICVEKYCREPWAGIMEDYKDWSQMGLNLANSFGELGRDYFHRLSATSNKYRASDCDKKYDEFLRHRRGATTVASIYAIFARAGVQWKAGQ